MQDPERVKRMQKKQEEIDRVIMNASPQNRDTGLRVRTCKKISFCIPLFLKNVFAVDNRVIGSLRLFFRSLWLLHIPIHYTIFYRSVLTQRTQKLFEC